jgi:mono/diheme cytochrome c family protein
MRTAFARRIVWIELGTAAMVMALGGLARASSGEGFILSRNPDSSTDDREFTRDETVYMLIFSDRVDFENLRKAEWQLKGDRDVKQTFTNHFDGTYTASFDLSELPSDDTSWEWRARIEDGGENRYRPRTGITVLPSAPRCSTDMECDDGAFCNGRETCVEGRCRAGSDPCPGENCDEATDTCGGLIGEGFTLSRNSDLSTDDRDFTYDETVYMLMWSDRVDFNDIKAAEWELRAGDRIKQNLTNHFDGTYTAFIDLSVLPSDGGGGDAVAGQAVYLRSRCGVCHGFDGSGPENIQGERAGSIEKHAGMGEDHAGGAFPELTPADFENIAAYLGSFGTRWEWKGKIEDNDGRRFRPRTNITISAAQGGFPPLLPGKTIGFDLVGIHDASSANYNGNCIGCHGDRTNEVALDGVTLAAHSRMQGLFGEGNDGCMACHPSGPDFLTFSRGGLREQVDIEATGCTSCHGAGAIPEFYAR